MVSTHQLVKYIFEFLHPLVHFNYLLKACWNSNFRASRGTEISKFSGALPQDPVGIGKCKVSTHQLMKYIFEFLHPLLQLNYSLT